MDATKPTTPSSPSHQSVSSPLEYAHLAARQPRLVIREEEDGRVSLLGPPPRKWSAWTNFLAAPVGLVLVIAGMICVAPLPYLLVPLVGRVLTFVALLLLVPLVLRVVSAFERTGGGRVTMMEVDGPWPVWSRRVIGGGAMRRCLLANIVGADVILRDGMPLLLIVRRGGAAVAAFEGCAEADLRVAARLLEQAIARAPREATP